jgi:O-acetyl-ADP-ribose deacetylase
MKRSTAGGQMNYQAFKDAVERYYRQLQLQELDSLNRLEAPRFNDFKMSMERDEETFQVLLFRFIDQKQLTDAEVYKKAFISRQHFSKIRSDQFYIPKKETVMKFIVALELTMSEAEDILAVAGYAFATSFWLDVVILYCVEEHIFDALKIDTFLIEKGQPPLFSEKR